MVADRKLVDGMSRSRISHAPSLLHRVFELGAERATENKPDAHHLRNTTAPLVARSK